MYAIYTVVFKQLR